MYICTYECMYVCTYECMYICTYECMYIWMYVHTSVYIHKSACTPTHFVVGPLLGRASHSM